jgi:GT2 family glycosyltransferase
MGLLLQANESADGRPGARARWLSHLPPDGLGVKLVDVSVVIVSWNTRDLLRDCLRSIFQEARSTAFEVIVVDNASQDSTARMVATEFPRVKLIVNADNLGFAAANNQGIRESAGRYVLLLNPDTVVLDCAIDRCVSYADNHPDVGVVGCQVLLDDKTIQKTGFAFPSAWNLALTVSGLSRAFPNSRVFGAPELQWWGRDDERDLDVVSGMFMLIPRKAFDEVGLLDEDYFIYTEEADLCFRLARAGWRRVFVPSAKIRHVCGGSGSTAQASARMYVQIQKSNMVFFKKNRNRASWVAAKAIYVVSNFVRGLSWYGLSLVERSPGRRIRAAAAFAALRYHVLGTEPQ